MEQATLRLGFFEIVEPVILGRARARPLRRSGVMLIRRWVDAAPIRPIANRDRISRHFGSGFSFGGSRSFPYPSRNDAPAAFRRPLRIVPRRPRRGKILTDPPGLWAKSPCSQIFRGSAVHGGKAVPMVMQGGLGVAGARLPALLEHRPKVLVGYFFPAPARLRPYFPGSDPEGRSV